MFSLVKITLLSIKAGPTVNAVGNLGFGKGESPNPNAAESLRIPWRTKTPGNDASSILEWQARVARFVGREKEMDALKQWADDDSRDIGIRFVIAAGGSGKSRIGAEFAAQMQEEGWAAGFVNLRKGSSFLMESKGTLLVIDYPEEHINQIRELLTDLANIGEGHRIRVLLLTRQERAEWDDVIRATGAHSLFEPEDLRPGPIDATSAREIFNDTAIRADEAFNPNAKDGAEHLLTSQDAMAEWTEADINNKNPLFIMAAAVNSAQSPDVPELNYSGEKAMAAVASRELDRYIRLAKEKGFEGQEYILARAKAITALAGPLSLEQLQKFEQNSGVPLGFGDKNAKINLRHSGLFNEDGIVPILQPDLLAAAFMVEVLSRRPKYAEAAGQEVDAALVGSIQEVLDAGEV